MTEPIDDTSTGKLMEGVLAAFAQFDNDVRSERTLAGMKAALTLGRWTFQAPLGYLNAPKWSKSSLVLHPDRAPLVKQAFEDMASGRFTIRDVIRRATEAGLRTRRDRALSPQTFGNMLRTHAAGDCAGAASRPAHGPRAPPGPDRDAPRADAHRELVTRTQRPLRVRTCPRRSAARSHPARSRRTPGCRSARCRCGSYYHCPGRCRTGSVSKGVLEGAFVDELALLQPTPGYMRLIKDRILYAWEQRRAEARDRTADVERRVKSVRHKLDRLDEAFLYAESIDLATYTRQRDKLREELTLSQIDHHTEAVDESMSRVSWRSRSASCRAPRICGYRRRWTTSSGSSSCCSPRASRTTAIGSFEPP
ncbi:hypothetical protein LuPra_03897 [Luteitalea pratensis]|uniref:Resolvase/invertase-type recombinase catalytic domain-containing protein n=1 Tax=Luteitalea pratensis TaxID=1855912 RepID=A0A143PRA1_LUTPR|nr:hypothetical protein LuPra_03897 [Luteitalea pratensis]